MANFNLRAQFLPDLQQKRQSQATKLFLLGNIPLVCNLLLEMLSLELLFCHLCI